MDHLKRLDKVVNVGQHFNTCTVFYSEFLDVIATLAEVTTHTKVFVHLVNLYY